MYRNLNQFQNNRKIKIAQAPSVVETFPNIKQQFRIDVDATRTALTSKNILLFVFQFLEKMFSNSMFELLRAFDNFKHMAKLLQTVGFK